MLIDLLCLILADPGSELDSGSLIYTSLDIMATLPFRSTFLLFLLQVFPSSASSVAKYQAYFYVLQVSVFIFFIFLQVRVQMLLPWFLPLQHHFFFSNMFL